MTDQLLKLLPEIKQITKQAGRAVLDIYNADESVQVATKKDNTPLTSADLAAHKIIMQGLQQLKPAYPLLSEESIGISFDDRKNWQRYWLVDPLDGTKEFIEQTDEFSILIALIDNHKPIMGVIYAPVLDEIYYAITGHGAFYQKAYNEPVAITVTAVTDNLRIISSRRHGQSKFVPFLTDFIAHQIVNRGSALKFAAIAMGEADIYPRFGPTSEWDTAAGQCIVTEAGGKVMDLSGKVLQYNTKESLLNPEFVVVGDPSRDWLANMQRLGITS
jgi:3'(2'), 5'-bisphosphate nucleotidase